VEQTLHERGLDDRATLEAGRGYPLKRLGTVDEVASMALFLASDEAAYITGTVLPVDGGYCIGFSGMGAEHDGKPKA
jgi:NAD(P)-dependent dehydrogenase (short-subunit alcohol dehydrogenase family)